MATVGPDLAAGGFTVGIALFGIGMGFNVSQLGNIVMSSVDDSARSEAGGLQGTAQNLGAALGTAFIGAVLLTGLTTGFQDRIRANEAIPAALSEQIVSATKAGVQIVSKDQVEEFLDDAGIPQDQADAIVDDYGDAQIEALKKSFFWAGILTLIGFAFAARLPSGPLGKEPEWEPSYVI